VLPCNQFNDTVRTSASQIKDYIIQNLTAANVGLASVENKSVSQILTDPYITGLIDIDLGVMFNNIENPANTCLDYYSELPWTPVDATGNGVPLSHNSCFSTRIGNMVTFQGMFSAPSNTTAVRIAIKGLPWKCAESARFTGVLYTNATPDLLNASSAVISGSMLTPSIYSDGVDTIITIMQNVTWQMKGGVNLMVQGTYFTN